MRTKLSKNMPDNNKVQIFSTILVSLVILVLYADGLLFRYLRDAHKISEVQQKSKFAIITSGNIRLRSVKEDLTQTKKANSNPFITPLNVTEGERIAWLQRSLPKLEIFKSDLLSKQFHSRVLQFFNSECEVRVFMTWISQATSFGSRELLAVESLFKAHPKGCLVILSRTLDSAKGYTILKPLIDRHLKVHAVAPDLSFLFKDTPAETWLDDLKKGNKDPGEISLAQNLSNIMRLAILYKYGGIYLDTDFIVLKPLTGLRNSIGAQSVDFLSKNWTRLNNAVLIFDMNHPLLLNFIEEFSSTFDGNRWGHNGPYLVSRVVRKVGPRAEFNVTVLPPMAFYPVDWKKIGDLFQRPKSEAQLRWVKAKVLQLSGESYGVHLWNRQSSSLLIEEGSAMGRLISGHCVTCKDIYSS